LERQGQAKHPSSLFATGTELDNVEVVKVSAGETQAGASGEKNCIRDSRVLEFGKDLQPARK
jgi:hypothetical protein